MGLNYWLGYLQVTPKPVAQLCLNEDGYRLKIVLLS